MTWRTKPWFPSRPGRVPPPAAARRDEGVRAGSRSPDFHTFLRGGDLSKSKARPRKAEGPPGSSSSAASADGRSSPGSHAPSASVTGPGPAPGAAAQAARHVSQTPCSGHGHGIKRSRGHLGMRGQGHPRLAGGMPARAQTRVAASTTRDLAPGTGAGTLLGAAGPLRVLQGLEGKQSSLAGAETRGVGHLPRQRALGTAHARPETEGRGPNASRLVFLGRLGRTRGALPHVCSLLPTLRPAHPEPQAHLSPGPQGMVPCRPQPSSREGSRSSRHSWE